MLYEQIYDIATSKSDTDDTIDYSIKTGQFTSTFVGEDWNLTLVYVQEPNEDCVLALNLYDQSADVRYVMYSDDVNFKYHSLDGERVVELELEEDFLEKFTAIVNGDWFDPRVLVPIDITDNDFILIAKAAHLKDMTMNEFINSVLEDELDRLYYNK